MKDPAMVTGPDRSGTSLLALHGTSLEAGNVPYLLENVARMAGRLPRVARRGPGVPAAVLGREKVA